MNESTDTMPAVAVVSKRPVSRLAPRPRPKHRRRRDNAVVALPWPVLAGGIAIVVVASAFGGAALGGGSASPGAGGGRLAIEAARAWVDGTAFGGPRAPGVPTDLGRSGPATMGVVEAVGSTTSAGITSQLFVVAPPSGSAYGLSVVITGGRVAYPVTVSPLPFASSIPSGHPATVPEGGRTVVASATVQARRWALSAFGSPERPVRPLGYGVDGPVEVLREWVPSTGAAFAIRVRVPLSGPGPSTAQPPAVVAASRQIAADARTVAASRAAVAADAATVTADTTALRKALAAEQTAETAAQEATPDHPRRAAREAGEAATDQTHVISDRSTLTTARAAEATQQSRLVVALRVAAADAVTLRSAEAAMSSTAISVYDVAYGPHGQPVAWAPADYGIGRAT